MKFKARIKVAVVPELIRVLQCLEKVEKNAFLYLQKPEDPQIRFVIMQYQVGSVLVHACFNRDYLFDEYRIVSKNNNEIGLELELASLLRAMKSASSAESLVIKLSKKDVEVLAFEIQTRMGVVLQDVPVRILSPTQLAACGEPQTELVVGLSLPHPILKSLYLKADRLKALDNHVRITLSLAEISHLILEVRNESVNIHTTFGNLSRARPESLQASMDEKDISAVVDSRQLSRSLFGYHAMSFQFQSTQLSAFIFLWRTCVMVHFPFESQGGYIAFYIPLVISD